MQIDDSFRVDVPVDEAWRILLDIERIAPCLPGAQLQEIEGDEYRGVVKVKVGPITAQYKGAAKLESVDDATHTAILVGDGSRHPWAGERLGHDQARAPGRRRGHAGRRRHRPVDHRQGGAVRPRGDGRRVGEAARAVRREPRARRPAPRRGGPDDDRGRGRARRPRGPARASPTSWSPRRSRRTREPAAAPSGNGRRGADHRPPEAEPVDLLEVGGVARPAPARPAGRHRRPGRSSCGPPPPEP